jgi:hypothetical protein
MRTWALVMTLVLAATAAHAAGFDGRWSVLVITEKGDCDKGYRYEVNIAGGKVTYVGSEAGVSMTGNIAPSGQVSMTVGRSGGSKDERASGSGKLTANAGSGTWKASGADGNCSGRWEAERR